MKKDSSKSSLQQLVGQQLTATQASRIKGGTGDTTAATDIVITDAVLL